MITFNVLASLLLYCGVCIATAAAGLAAMSVLNRLEAATVPARVRTPQLRTPQRRR